MVDPKIIIELKRQIVDKFTEENWHEMGLLTGFHDEISGHSRLLRSLHFGDEDYAGCVVAVLSSMASQKPKAIEQVRSYIDETFGQTESDYVSLTPPGESRRITFCPNVFKVPDMSPDEDMVSVMMPFATEYGDVYKSIEGAVRSSNMRCKRADSIWEASTFIQDIFALIYRSNVVIVDFTNRNPNVMYETGIAHTLGKHVIPITQSLSDIPSDLNHHRVLKYLNNQEGLSEMSVALTKRLQTLYSPQYLWKP